MPTKKTTKKVEKTPESAVIGARFEPAITLVDFADVATLKDKLNEVITHLNK